ncbi:MAG: STAS domain-containing protein [Actinomycetota bacterium]
MSEFHIDRADDGRTIAVVGDLDPVTAPQLRAALAESDPGVRLDLSGCTFMDSSGISVLSEAFLRQCPGLSVVEASRPVRLVLEVSGVADTFLQDRALDPLPDASSN